MANAEKWEMPEWMEEYRDIICNTGGNSIEDLLNDHTTNSFNNSIRAGLIVAVHSQVVLLERLRHHGKLANGQPLDILLFCPNCGKQHIDEPQPEKNWTNPPHRSHECQFCHWTWRPADVPTNGVEKIQTKGTRDGDAEPCPIAIRRTSQSTETKNLGNITGFVGDIPIVRNSEEV